MTPEARERILDALALEQRHVNNYETGAAGHVMHPGRWTMVSSTHGGFLQAAARAVIGLWAQQPRVCVCPVREQLNQVVEPDGSCSRCLGRIVRSAPFKAES